MKSGAVGRKMLIGVTLLSIIILGSTQTTFALKLNVNGLIQLQLKSVNSDKEEEKVNEMYLRRLKLTFFGKVTKQIDLKLEPEYGKNEAKLKDAYFKYNGGTYNIRGGNHLVPFGAESLVDDRYLLCLERSLATELSPQRHVGTSVFWESLSLPLSIQGGIWSARFNKDAESSLVNDVLIEKQVFSDDDEEGSRNVTVTATRFEYKTAGLKRNSWGYLYKAKPDTQYAVGLSAYQTSSYVEETNSVVVPARFISTGAYAVDFLYSAQKFNIDFEYSVRNLTWQKISFALVQTEEIKSTQTATSLMVHYPLSSTWSATARQETFVYDSKGQILKGPNGEAELNWSTVGLNADFSKHNTRLQLNYILKDEKMSGGKESINNNTLLLQSTVYF